MSKTPKLYRIWYSDGNDRDEYARVKATNTDQVIQWLKDTYFKPEALEQIMIDYTMENEAIITWYEGPPCNECTISAKDTNKCEEKCEYNETTYSLQIEEIEEPESNDYEYKTIYGTNDYYDLTQDKPVKAKDWNKTLAQTWKTDPQKGCDLLLKLTQDAIAKNKHLTEMEK